jgi:hypothetical protein
LNEKANWKMWLIRNWVEIKESENIMWTVWNNIKYVALKDNWKYWIFEDEKELLEFEVPEDYTLRRGGVAISPDNKNVAFVAKKDWKETLFENWIPWKEYFSVFNLMYSPDSKRLAYTASSMYGWEWDVIVLDWKEYKYNTYIKAIWFSPDSKIFAYDWWGYTIFFNWKPAIELKNAEANYGWFTDGFRFISSDDFYYMYNIRNSGWERVFVRIVCEKNIDTSSLEALEEKLEFTKNNLPSEYVNLINKTIGNLLKFQLREIYEKLEYIYLDKLVYDKNKYAIDYIELAILSKL